MVAKIIFFPVDNGDMTLIVLESGRTILIDVNVRGNADDPNHEMPDVMKALKKELKRDSQNRLYVDVFLLSHPDQDHCRGLDKHFHLGAPGTYVKADDKIFIHELWSSPIVFRRASSTLTLCEDAEAFQAEAKRRVRYFQDKGLAAVGDGNRVQILGEDENGKTDKLGEILVKIDELIPKVNGVSDSSLAARLLGPLPKSDDEEEEEALAKNRSSVIIQFTLKVSGVDACRFLTGGDSEVAIWERLWDKHKDTDWLDYDILQTPHHCSWHSLSYESWSELGEDAEVSEAARNALSQARTGAVIVASCKPIDANDSDPPCIGAKREYEAIIRTVNGSFKCTGEYLTKASPDKMEFEITRYGARLKSTVASTPALFSTGAIGREPLPHGEGADIDDSL